MEFRELNIKDTDALQSYKDEFILYGESMDGAFGLIDQNVSDFIWGREAFKHRERTPASFVPSHTFVLVVEDRILGIINIRHELNDYLFNYGGHIGYSVRKSERQKGYAKEMLYRALEFAFQTLNLERVLITCDSHNLGSEKTILACGGILENIVQENENEFIKRYWVESFGNLKT